MIQNNRHTINEIITDSSQIDVLHHSQHNNPQQNIESIKACFSKAASQYHEHAILQREIALSLAQRAFDEWQLFSSQFKPNPSEISIFEVGCGTGFLSAPLFFSEIFSQSYYVATDLSDAMLSACQQHMQDDARWQTGMADRIKFLSYDATQCTVPDYLPVHTSRFGLITSSLCLQWVNAIEDVLNHLWHYTDVLVVNMLLDSSFSNWRKAHQHANMPCKLQNLIAYDRLQTWVDQTQSASCQASLSRVSHLQQFENGMDFPRHLKQIGAHLPNPNAIAQLPITSKAPKQNWQQLQAFLPSPFVVNYDVATVCVRRI